MLSLTLERIDNLATQTKNFATRRQQQMAAGNVGSSLIFDVHINMKRAAADLTAAASVSGIVQYAKDQKNDQNLDVVAEFNAMITAINAVVTAIESTFPDSGGFLLAQTWGTNGPEDRQFAPASTAGIRTQLQGVIDAIN